MEMIRKFINRVLQFLRLRRSLDPIQSIDQTPIIDQNSPKEIDQDSPKGSTAPNDDQISADRFRLGYQYYVQKDYPNALKSYNEAIKKSPTAGLFSNRALTYLALKKPNLALKDCEFGLELDGSNVPLLYRKAKSLLLLHRYKEAMIFLESRSDQSNRRLKILLAMSQRLIQEQENGRYDLLEMIKEKKNGVSGKFENMHAEYVAPIFKLQWINEKKGRGLVATKKIEPGTLLMACKAFAFGSRKHILDLASILDQIARKLTENPKLAKDFYKLHAGKDLKHSDSWDKENLVDLDRIGGILRMNGFNANGAIFESPFVDQGEEKRAIGVWLLPSMINHSCVDTNCYRYFVGDIIFVRAIKFIEKGQEILFQYFPPFCEDRERRLRFYGFECECRLCQAIRRETPVIRNRFKAIEEYLDHLERQNPVVFFQDRMITVELEQLLNEAIRYREKSLNPTAAKIQLLLAPMLFREDPDRAMKLLKEGIFILYELSDLSLAFRQALIFARDLFEWKLIVDKWAMTLWGDDRVLELVAAGEWDG